MPIDRKNSAVFSIAFFAFASTPSAGLSPRTFTPYCARRGATTEGFASSESAIQCGVMIARPTPCVMSYQAETSCSIPWQGQGDGVRPSPRSPQQPKDDAASTSPRASKFVGSLRAIGPKCITVFSMDSQKPSEIIEPSATMYCSKVCERMSEIPAAVWFAGTVNVYSGSRIEATG